MPVYNQEIYRKEKHWKEGEFDVYRNNLTTQGVVGETGYGAPYRCLLCKIYKCTPENSQVTPSDLVFGTKA